MGHRFQRRKAEAFVQRREDEYLGRIVKHAQHFNRNKTQKAHVILHATTDHCAPQIGMLGKFVADNINFRPGYFASFSSSAFNAEKASMIRTMFL